MSYNLYIAAKGCDECHTKTYKDADTAIRAGKRMMSNMADAMISVYEEDKQIVRWAKKVDWKWTSLPV
jgi:hypothetical protein